MGFTQRLGAKNRCKLAPIWSPGPLSYTPTLGNPDGKTDGGWLTQRYCTRTRCLYCIFRDCGPLGIHFNRRQMGWGVHSALMPQKGSYIAPFGVVVP